MKEIADKDVADSEKTAKAKMQVITTMEKSSVWMENGVQQHGQTNSRRQVGKRPEQEGPNEKEK